MPTQKDFKRLVRTRMQKTGETYTAARLQLLKKTAPPDYAVLAGMADASLKKRTGRSWSDWVRLLDAADAAKKPHREIAQYVASLGTPSWWTQTVTVGYERIRGLRERGQRRDGKYEATKSRTFAVPIGTLFDAFADTRRRRRWLQTPVTVRSATRPKSMRFMCDDGTSVVVGFIAKGAAKSLVAVAHQKLPDRATADAKKAAWSEEFDRLGELLSKRSAQALVGARRL